MRHVLLAVWLCAISGSAVAQAPVFRATEVVTSFYGPGGAKAAWNGQPDFTQWTAWPERGSQVVLTGASIVTEISVFYNQVGALAGGEVMTVRAYAVDGATAPGDASGTPYPTPGTLLWTSSPVAVKPGDRCARISVPSLAFPTDVVLTAQFTGGNYATGPFDPDLAANKAGLRFHGAPQVGSVPTNAFNASAPGLIWRKVYTSGGGSAWACDEPPAAWPPFNPSTAYGFGFVVWQGNMGLVGTPFDNQSLANAPQFYLEFPYTDQATSQVYDAAGARVTVEGTNRKLTQAVLTLGGDTTSNPNGTFVLKLWTPNDTDTSSNRGRPGTLLWASSAQSVPNGLDPTTNSQFTATIAVPNIVVPDEFCWTVEFSNLSGGAGANAGPYVRWSAGPGNASIGFYQRTSPGSAWEGPFVFFPQGWNNSGGFQYEVNAMLDAKFLGTAAEALVVPSTFSVNFGQVNSGDVASLAIDDGNVLRVCKFIVPNQVVPPVRVQIDNPASGVAGLSALRWDVKSRMASSGSFAQDLELFDFSLGSYRDIRTDVTNTSFAVRSLTATGNVAGYLGAGGALRSRYSVRKTGPSTAVNWCHEVDFAAWFASS